LIRFGILAEIVGLLKIRISKQDKKPFLNNNHLKSNHNPKSTINKISLQTSLLTLTPPCPKSIGGLTNNKKRVVRALRPSTQE
ncbi:hypothetical protein PIB30_103930, partial [Stylosanthes scabra]|nr:hypothetical protein [Stylosanthes scabra]